MADALPHPGSDATPPAEPLPFRVGYGFDLHRLERPGEETTGTAKPLVLAGIEIPDAKRGVIAHSDGDAVFHAVTDALLGAVGRPDIGELFPDSDPRWAGASSDRFLAEAVRLVGESGYGIGNVDLAVVLQSPRLSPHKARMRTNLARCLDVPESRVNLKGKTHERLDAVGRDEAVLVHAVVLVIARSRSRSD